MVEQIELTVQVFTGGLFHVKVNKDATVRNLMDVISIEGRLGADRFVVTRTGEDRQILLDDDTASLKEYGVKNGSHVYVVLTPPDTSPSEPLPPEGWSSPKFPRLGGKGGAKK